MTNQITAQLFETMIQHGSAALNLEKQMINDLNVFPVPDGDTGTNMGMTIQAAAAEFNRRHGSTVGESASIAASALLRGARGNSGVILSLLFRGISKSLKGKTEAGPAEFAAALQDGVTAAYSGVMKPAGAPSSPFPALLQSTRWKLLRRVQILRACSLQPSSRVRSPLQRPPT